MSERRYNDDEVDAIFAKAAQGQRSLAAGASREDGLTLPQLQEIGREVGIAPDAIARAAHELVRREEEPPRRFFGLPLAVQRTIQLDRRMTDDEWEHLVVQLRQVFNARGTLRQEGSFRQWTNGNLQALLEPTPTGDRLRLRTLNGNARASMSVGLVALGTSGATAIAMAAGGHLANSLPGIFLLGLIGVGMFANGALRVPGWANRRRRQMEAIDATLALPPATAPDEG